MYNVHHFISHCLIPLYPCEVCMDDDILTDLILNNRVATLITLSLILLGINISGTKSIGSLYHVPNIVEQG